MCFAPKAQHSLTAWGNAPGFVEHQKLDYLGDFDSLGRCPRLQMRQRLWRYRETTNPRLALRFSEANGANQSPPLKPAQPKNAEQPTRDRCRLGNDRATNLNVIDSELEIVAVGLPTGEE